MRFLTIYKAKEDPKRALATTEELAAMGQLIEEMTKEGVLLATEGCLPSVTGARVRRDGDKISVTDGPFTEAKELIAGFAIIQATSKAEAIEQAKRFLRVAGDGESEIRQIAEASDFGEEFTPELRAQEERQRERMASRH
jgi:hypothetical protein